MHIAISSDHAGYEDLLWVKGFVESLGHSFENFGPSQFDPDDDYPDYILPAARAVAGGQCDVGIIIGGSGQGEAIVANRVSGVRAALFYGPFKSRKAIDINGTQSADAYEILRLSRQHNDANILSLSSRFLLKEEMKRAIKIWLETPFSDELRHGRRIAKIDESQGV